MKIKKHMPKVMSGILCFALVFGSLFPASATDVIITETLLEETPNSETGQTDNEGIPEAELFSVSDGIDAQFDETRYETIEVTYNQASNYLVTIPKTINLSADKTSSYPIKVEGDILASRQVCVVPVDGIAETEVFDFYMSDQIAGSTKSDVVAEISQNKFYWNHEEVANGYEETENYIVAEGLSAGRWKGTFQMEISMRIDPAHIHNYVGEITKEPTCTDSGEKTYTCADCGDSYTETVDPAGHNFVDGECTDCGEKDPDHQHSYTETVTKEPTCTEAGEKTLVCSCGDTKTEIIPATGHNFVDGECTDCGGKDPDYHRHSYTEVITKEPTCTEAGEKTYTCTCGDSYTETVSAKGHSYGDNDKCVDCGTLNPDHQHSYTETVTKEPTCTETGEKTYTCTCGDTKTESISATGHNYVDGICTNCHEEDPNQQHGIGAGLYDENGVLLASADDLLNTYGFDVTKDCWDYNTNATSLCNILKNNEELSSGVKLVVPDDVTYVGDCAFINCTQLKSVVLPNALEDLGSYAFRGCSNLEELSVPISLEFNEFNVMDVSKNVYDFPNLKRFIITKGTGIPVEWSSNEYTPWYKQTHDFTVKIEEGVTRIGSYTFYKCGYLVDVEMADSVTEIGDWAFQKCTRLTTNLNALLPENLELLGRGTFSDCTMVKEENVIIPSKITEIPEECFWGVNRNVGRTVKLPEGLTAIGAFSFSDYLSESIGPVGSGCDIEIPSTVTKLGNSAFSSNINLKTIVLPDGITSLGYSVFRDCSALCDVYLPDSLVSMGGAIFQECNALKTLYVPASVEVIDITNYTGGLFYSHDHGSYTYQNSLAKIYCGATSKPSGWESDWNCYGYGQPSENSTRRETLHNLTYWNVTREQYESTYKDPDHQHSYTETVTKEPTCTEAGEKKLTCRCGNTKTESISATGHNYVDDECTYCGEKNPEHQHSYTETVTKEPTCTEAGEKTLTCSCGDTKTESISAGHSYENHVCTKCGLYEAGFYDADNNLVVSWEDSRINVSRNYTSSSYKTDSTSGYSVLQKYPNVTKVVIPNSVTRICEYAFYDCSSLTSISIPSSVTSIDRYAFTSCKSLTSIIIPSSVTSIGYEAFQSCYKLTSITIPGSVTSIGNYAFAYCSSLTNVTIQNGVTSIGSSAFYNCSSLTSITIPDSVTSIYPYAFNGCTSLTSITIPSSVTSIGSSAFWNCTGLTSITIPSSVTSIGNSAFRDCTDLTNVTIQNGVTNIDNYLFYNCSSLISITIPSSVTSINKQAFYNCSKLTTVNYTGTQQQWNAIRIDTSYNDSLFNATKNYNYTG